MRQAPIKGRGLSDRREGRFQSTTVEYDDVSEADEEPSRPATVLKAMPAKTIVARNQSPDIPFDRSINPYMGCEHGCVYCYARPSHSYLDLSPGIDFETRIFYKENATDRLLELWSKKGYQPEPITIGANTDPYQPAERRLGITRQLLELFLKHRHPVSLITKGTLILRDLDLLADLAGQQLASVAVSIPTADNALKRVLEPRVPAAAERFKAVRQLVDAGIPVTVMMAPVIPFLNDREIERIVEKSAVAGAADVAWILLRLPHELKSLVSDWLDDHYPERAGHIMSLIRQASGGKHYDNRFGTRQRGTGPYAAMLARRFDAARRRFALARSDPRAAVVSHLFVPPSGPQMDLLL